MPTITKRDLARILVEHTGMRNGAATRCVGALFEALRESIAEGQDIQIRRFGSWRVEQTNPSPNARNPRTGERVHVPARRKVMFRPGKVLRKELGRPLGDGRPPGRLGRQGEQ